MSFYKKSKEKKKKLYVTMSQCHSNAITQCTQKWPRNENMRYHGGLGTIFDQSFEHERQQVLQIIHIPNNTAKYTI